MVVSESPLKPRLLGALSSSALPLSLGQLHKRVGESGWRGSVAELEAALESLRAEGSVAKGPGGAWRLLAKTAEPAPSKPTTRPAQLDEPPDVGTGWERLRKLIRYYIDALEAEHRPGITLWAEDEGRRWLRWPLASRWKPDLGEVQRIPLREWMGGFLTELANGGDEVSVVYGFPLLVRRFVVRKTGEEATVLVPAAVWELVWRVEGDWLTLQSRQSEPAWLNEDWANEFLPKTAARQWVDEQLDGVAKEERSEALLKRVEALIPPGRWAERPDARTLKLLPSGQTEWREGVYPSGILAAFTGSKFTRGLISELRWIADRASDTQINDSSLATVFRSLRDGEPAPAALGESNRIGVRGVFLPPDRHLNREQVQAVRLAFTEPVTLVVGPPGTGKTDVGAAIGLNAALQQQSVLICSRNNVAVDEVEKRLRDLDARLGAASGENSGAPLVQRAGSTWGGKERVNDWEALRQIVPKAIRLCGRRTSRGENSVGPAGGRPPEIEAIFRKQADLLDTWNRLELAVEDYVAAMRRAASTACPESWCEDADYRWVASVDIPLAEDRLRRFQAFEEMLRWVSRLPGGTVLKRVIERLFGDRQASRARALQDSLDPGNAEGRGLTQDTVSLSRRLEYIRSLRELEETRRGLESFPSSGELLGATQANDQLIGERTPLCWSSWFRDRVASLSDAEYAGLSRLKDLLSMGEGKGLKPADRRVLAEERATLSPLLTRLVPVWCCTNLSLRKKLPLRAGIFDLALIDEASQCDVPSAIPILFRAKRIIAIGDNNQLRHVSRLAEEDDERLLAQRDLGIHEIGYLHSKKSLYDIVENVLLGSKNAGGLQVLHLHYRCHPEIISFCSDTFYDEPLEVLTDTTRLTRPSNLDAGISWSPTKGPMESAATGCVSDAEARECLSVVKAILKDPLFSGSIGVVTPFRQQAIRIREYVDQHVSTDVAAKHGLISDTAHAFQGGQRDVIVLSLMYGDGMPAGSKIFLERQPNLFNVALSRATSALRVVGDLEAARESPIDHIRRFAKYFDSLQARRAAPRNVPQSSIWEGRFSGLLAAAGIQTSSQHPADRYFLDLAYVENGARIAIEVDGEKYHLDDRGRRVLSDYARDLRLRSLGWTVVRFWVWQIRDHPDECVQKVRRVIADYNSPQNRSQAGNE